MDALPDGRLLITEKPGRLRIFANGQLSAPDCLTSRSLDGNRLSNLNVIWRQTPKTLARGHFGNRIVFGRDGLLYITSGERMRFDPGTGRRCRTPRRSASAWNGGSAMSCKPPTAR